MSSTRPLLRYQRSRLLAHLAYLSAFVSKYEKYLAGGLALCALIGGVATYLALSSVPPLGHDPDTISWLLTVDLVVVLLLGLLVVQRVAGLYIGRKRGHGASHLQMRMVWLFSLLATAPAILLVLFSMFFFQLGVQSWFSTQVSTAVHEAQAVASAYLDEHRKVIRADMIAMASDIDRQSALIYADPAGLTRFMDAQSFLRNFNETIIFDGSGRVIGRGGVGLGFDPSSIPPASLETAALGDAAIYTSPDSDEKIQAVSRIPSMPDTYLYVSRSVDPVVLSYLSATRDASNNYKALELRSSNLQFQFFAVYLMVSLLLLSTAVWGGLYLAGQLVNPIEGLIDAAEQVREGNLSTRVPEQQGLDEFDDLARTFNRMTVQLEQQRRELINANHKLDERRRFTETVLAGVTSGVIAVDADRVIRMVNEPALRILALKKDDIVGQKITQILPELDMPALTTHESGQTRQQEIGLSRRDHQRRSLLVRLAPDASKEEHDGAILTFDDITELQSAQRKSAWSDVARRVAHEIKNPLTPIQLSAERLRRRFSKEIPDEDLPIFQQCVDTIIRHVGDIGRMVGEFASFARMPEPVMKSDDLGVLVREIVALHSSEKTGVTVQVGGLLAGTAPVPLLMDGPQLRQALTNLVLNASESVGNRMAGQPLPAGRVLVYLQSRDGQYILSVLDNGLGFPKGIPLERLTEPYVTFRDKGTGLGLAIVKKITEDHKGSLRLDGPDGIREAAGWGPEGAVVSLILPIPLDQSTITRQDSVHAA